MNLKARYNRHSQHSLARKLLTVFLAGQMFFGNVFTASAAPVDGTITDVVEQFEYDGNGNVTARHDGNGNVIGYEYDDLSRLTGIDYPGGNSPDVTFVYGIDGNLSEMHDDTGITYYGYDQLGRTTSIDYSNGGFMRYAYDNVGNRTDVQYGAWLEFAAGGEYRHTRYEYNENGRIVSVRDMVDGGVTSYEYDETSAVKRRTLPNGIYSEYAHGAAIENSGEINE